MDDHSTAETWTNSSGDRVAAGRRHDSGERARLSMTEVKTAKPSRPFVWQSGRRLLLLEREHGSWVMAELEFEPHVCRYSELRRATYTWEREAVGAFLSRALAYGNEAALESADQLDMWMRRG